MLHRTIRRLTLTVGAVALLTGIFASAAAAAPLEAETQAATSIKNHSATLNGVIFKEKESFAMAGYEYGTTTEYGSESDPTYLTGQSGSIELPITVEDLEYGTTYHFRIGVFGEDGKVVYGEDMTFKTTSPFESETQAATNVGSYSATLNGSIFKQKETFGMAGFEYGTTTEYGLESDPIDLTGQSGAIDIPIGIEGLQPETTYHFRAGAFGEDGKVVYGEDMTFTTRSEAKFMMIGSSPASLSLESISADPLSFGLEGGEFSCESLTATGALPGTGFLLRAAEVSLTPSFAGCDAIGFTNASVDPNGCTFVLHAGDSGTATGSMDIACPEGAAIEVTAATCGFSIPAQTGLAPITETNDYSTEPNSVKVEPDANGLEYVKTKDGWLCSFNGTGAKADGTYTGAAVLWGFKESTPKHVSLSY